MHQPFGVMDTLGIARDLGADDAGSIGLQFRATHPPDALTADHLDVERTSRRTIMRTGGVADIDLRIDLGALVHRKMVTSNAGASERIYPAVPPDPRTSYALCAEIGSAIGVNGLAGHVARAWAAQEPDDRGDILGPAALARQGPMREVMRRFWLALRARRTDQSGNHAVHGDTVVGKIVGQSAGEADNAGLGCDDMGAVAGARMRAEATDIDDGSLPAVSQCRKAGLGAVKGAVERHIEDFTPLGIVHLGKRLLPPQRRIVDQNIDAAETGDRSLSQRGHRLGIGDVADMDQCPAARSFDLARHRV